MKAKKHIITFLVVVFIMPAIIYSQGVAINNDNSEADPSAMLDVKSNNKGLLIPRMTQLEIEAIANPANGLLVFSTTDDKFYAYIQSENTWKEFAYYEEPCIPTPSCDDGISCTLDYFDEEICDCVHEPNNNQCDDGQFCNGEEICDPVLGCMAGTPPDLDDGIPCTNDYCDESLDMIVHDPNDNMCDDGLYCTGVEYCDTEFGCTSIPLNMGDGIDCTVDICNEVTNTILHTPDDSACDDGNPNTQDECSGINGCTHTPIPCGDPITDPRDGQTYNTVQIGTQCWMAENLKIGTMISGSGNQADNGTIEKYCYDDNASNCDTYGGLYQWNEMMVYVTTEGTQGICPDGWHVPTDAEWCTLENEADAGTISCSTENWRGIDVGHNLRETGTTHWASPNAGATNSTGFTLLPGGYYYNTSFFSQTYLSFQWSSSTETGNDAWARQFYFNQGGVFRSDYNKNYGGRVRCLKD